MNMLMSMSFMLSLTFLFMNHPLSVGFILLIQTIIISILTGLLNYNFWFSYILFLVMIGGMLILFIYMTSISSNKKFKFSMKIMLLMMLMFIVFMISYFIDLYFMNYMNFNMNMFNFDQYIEYYSLNKFMNYPNYLSLFMLFIYLFITLIAVTKICNLKSGPLRQKF
uniref:NADH-ubiquinone oxidoreductase chain 6 n=1 Tax=Xenostrongylus variegatus TaxID=2748664 RepID=A0A8F0HZF3_9CUCU|nr:NADH dehydrogenase subunit 6 [Xenostrongylus variegatus]